MLDWILSDTDNIGLVVTLIGWGAYGIAAGDSAAKRPLVRTDCAELVTRPNENIGTVSRRYYWDM